MDLFIDHTTKMANNTCEKTSKDSRDPLKSKGTKKHLRERQTGPAKEMFFEAWKQGRKSSIDTLLRTTIKRLPGILCPGWITFRMRGADTLLEGIQPRPTTNSTSISTTMSRTRRRPNLCYDPQDCWTESRRTTWGTPMKMQKIRCQNVGQNKEQMK